MKLFKCSCCEQLLYFENFRCEKCSHRLGYIPDLVALVAVESQNDFWSPVDRPGKRYRFCSNADYSVCNWLIPAESSDRYCAACRHNRTIPDLGSDANYLHWQRLEDAKHRLFYTLNRLRLPLQNRIENPAHGLTFDFKSSDLTPEGHVTTGHSEGVITIALEEADDAERERRRHSMGEPYRTLLGHFRHEVGHYFWDLLVRDAGNEEGFRAVFGDERANYGKALERHYRDGPPPAWQNHFISAYASSHPWEDWAESWAHYLHILDTLEMAYAFGMHVRPNVSERPDLNTKIDFDPYKAPTIDRLIEAWLPLTFAMNSLNRAMGHHDLYPFVLSPTVIGKLGYIHRIVADRADAAALSRVTHQAVSSPES